MSRVTVPCFLSEKVQPTFKVHRFKSHCGEGGCLSPSKSQSFGDLLLQKCDLVKGPSSSLREASPLPLLFPLSGKTGSREMAGGADFLLPGWDKSQNCPLSQRFPLEMRGKAWRD